MVTDISRHSLLVRRPCLLHPFSLRLHSLLSSPQLPPLYVHVASHFSLPPWEVPAVRVCSFSLPCSKAQLPTVASCSLFLDHFHSHSHATAVYTDGSKSSDGIGFSAVFPDSVVQGHLLSSASIFTAELYAILAALIRIPSMPVSSFVVVSDSLSALQAIRKFDTSHPLVLRIQLWLCRISTKHKDIVFCWVPGHVDVQGNEQADTAARSAVHDLPISYRGVPFLVYFAAITTHLRTRWQQCWSTLLGNKLHSIKQSIGYWLSSCHQCRGWETTLSRLRIGHTRLTHGYLMERHPVPLCEQCQVPVSISHILLDCPLYQRARRIYLQRRLRSTTVSLPSLLADGPSFNPDSLIDFLTTTDLLHKL
ncbi:uncharacterized protein [Cherax quadricarinatus]|uniref:uncharacterized protein isoform X2 n=1 Tax=Cherax quadricarinatus TaxID=27406 RepID=UPI00387E4B7E